MAYIVLYKRKKNSYPIKRRNDTGISGEFGDLVITHMIDELEQADPNLIKIRRQIESVKKRIDEMKWKMRKIVLLALIVSTLFSACYCIMLHIHFSFKIRHSSFQSFACFS